MCLGDSNLDRWVRRWKGWDATDVPIIVFCERLRGRTEFHGWNTVEGRHFKDDILKWIFLIEIFDNNNNNTNNYDNDNDDDEDDNDNGDNENDDKNNNNNNNDDQKRFIVFIMDWSRNYTKKLSKCFIEQVNFKSGLKRINRWSLLHAEGQRVP